MGILKMVALPPWSPPHWVGSPVSYASGERYLSLGSYIEQL
jgi:hypothetical protein